MEIIYVLKKRKQLSGASVTLPAASYILNRLAEHVTLMERYYLVGSVLIDLVIDLLPNLLGFI